jgi:hypothetical protein
MSRSQARRCYAESSQSDDGCYPESSQSDDGCFPDNDTTPSRFKCWEAGSADTPSPADLLSLFSSGDRRPQAPKRASRRGRGQP